MDVVLIVKDIAQILSCPLRMRGLKHIRFHKGARVGFCLLCPDFYE